MQIRCRLEIRPQYHAHIHPPKRILLYPDFPGAQRLGHDRPGPVIPRRTTISVESVFSVDPKKTTSSPAPAYWRVTLRARPERPFPVQYFDDDAIVGGGNGVAWPGTRSRCIRAASTIPPVSSTAPPRSVPMRAAGTTAFQNGRWFGMGQPRSIMWAHPDPGHFAQHPPTTSLGSRSASAARISGRDCVQARGKSAQ
jgi:hypothetical protein